MSAPFEAFFLPADGAHAGQRFCLYHPARNGAARGAVVHVHAFAEEMNKSRRMVALQCRALADAGYAVLQIDLRGCGDSSGEFGDASWEDWLADVELGLRWIEARAPGPLWLWGLRGGALVAAQAAQRFNAPCNLLLWQPPASGRQLLQQFLRLASAREMLGGGAKGAGDAVRNELAAGRAVDIAGYALSPALAGGLEAAALTPPAHAGQAVWIEIGSQPEPTPALRAARERWQAAGWSVQLHALPGAAFWQTAEIETVPALLPLTLQALDRSDATVPA